MKHLFSIVPILFLNLSKERCVPIIIYTITLVMISYRGEGTNKLKIQTTCNNVGYAAETAAKAEANEMGLVNKGGRFPPL